MKPEPKRAIIIMTTGSHLPDRPESSLARLLLIDDDQKFSRLLMKYLAAEGFDVGFALDGAAGLQRVRNESWDLIILDVMLPRINGFEVLRQLRDFSDTPVLMLTGRGAEDDVVTGLNVGADDYLPKTSSARELSARIRALLRRRSIQVSESDREAAEPHPEIVVGRIRIILDTRTVRVDEEAIELTSVEFALLAYLGRNKGRIRSREQLIEEVRNRRLSAFDRSIDVHIASLRKKLGDDARSSRFIRTVRSAGYLLIDGEPE